MDILRFHAHYKCQTEQRKCHKRNSVRNVHSLTYFDSVSFGLHGLIPDEEIEVLNSPCQPSSRLITNFGSFFDSYGWRHDELRLLVAGITEFRIPFDIEWKYLKHPTFSLSTRNHLLASKHSSPYWQKPWLRTLTLTYLHYKTPKLLQLWHLLNASSPCSNSKLNNFVPNTFKSRPSSSWTER